MDILSWPFGLSFGTCSFRADKLALIETNLDGREGDSRALRGRKKVVQEERTHSFLFSQKKKESLCVSKCEHCTGLAFSRRRVCVLQIRYTNNFNYFRPEFILSMLDSGTDFGRMFT